MTYQSIYLKAYGDGYQAALFGATHYPADTTLSMITCCGMQDNGPTEKHSVACKLCGRIFVIDPPVMPVDLTGP